MWEDWYHDPLEDSDEKARQHSEEDRPVGNAFCGARSVVHVDMMYVFSKGIIDGEAKSAGSSGVVQSGCEESS